MGLKNKDDRLMITKLLNKYPNRFMLSLALAKRCKTLKSGVTPLVEVEDAENYMPLEVSIREFSNDKIEFSIQDEDIDEESEVIQELDAVLGHEQEKEDDVSTDNQKNKDKGKSKSKSLAA